MSDHFKAVDDVKCLRNRMCYVAIVRSYERRLGNARDDSLKIREDSDVCESKRVFSILENNLAFILD